MRTLTPAILALALPLALVAPAHARDADTGALIAARLAEPDPHAAGIPLDAYLLRTLYEPRGWAPLWSAQNPRTVVAILRDAGQEGLDPNEYHPDAIAGRTGADDPASRADLDLLLSNGVLHYASDVRYGRVAPTVKTAQVAPVPKTIDPVALTRGVAEAPDPVLAMHALAPAHPQYRALREALGGYLAAPDGRSEAAVRQVAVNMERLRWLPDDLGTRYAMVNIPGFWLRVLADGQIVLEMPVVVGKDDWETPTFSSAINEVVFNPKWNVPVSIAKDEVLPAVRRDPGYVSRHSMKVYSGWGSDAAAIDPGAVNWKAVGPNTYRFVQVPGTRNPLGQIKFTFPNPFGVYLHDAPSRSLFQRPVRAFSHGCVRVGNAPALAALVMSDMPGWDVDRRQATIRTGKTRNVALRTPLPLHVTYQTAWVDPHGIVFRPDIYGRDAELARAIDGARQKPRITLPPPPPPPPAPVLEEPEVGPEEPQAPDAPGSTL